MRAPGSVRRGPRAPAALPRHVHSVRRAEGELTHAVALHVDVAQAVDGHGPPQHGRAPHLGAGAWIDRAQLGPRRRDRVRAWAPDARDEVLVAGPEVLEMEALDGDVERDAAQGLQR